MKSIKNMLLCIIFLMFLASPAPPQETTGSDSRDDLLGWLDRNNDGLINAYEGAEAFLYLVDEADQDGDGSVTADEIAHFFTEEKAGDIKEQKEIFKELDTNGDETLSPAEIPEEVLPLMSLVDSDGDQAISLTEFMNAPMDDPSILFEEELCGTVLDVEGRTAVMNGEIDSSTPGQILELILEHPEVDTLVMEEVPGSMDDEANLRAARLVRRRGFATIVPRDGVIASGGTDLFLAGLRRYLEPGARVGVHSWDGFGEEGADLPEDHAEHALYLDYYREMGVSTEFYWFTLEAASARDIHWMTTEEIDRFGLVTMKEEPVNLEEAYGLASIDITEGSRGIVPLPENTAQEIRAVFDRYTRILAPNSKPIHILAQSGWTEDQIVRARKVLEHLLTDAPDSLYGFDKSAVANAMADRRATLVLFDTEETMEDALEGELGELDLGMQDLRANECPVEGSADYMAHETRDAAFEEILHLVHDYGIRPALPRFDGEIQRCSDHAEKGGWWDPWPEDEPDSHRNEYIAAVYDNYLDLWTLPPTLYEGQALEEGDIPDDSSHFGTYRAGSRQLLSELDPDGLALVEKFFPPALTYRAELPEAFSGVFKLAYDPALRYTMKSQHLRHVMLRGDRPAGLVGNDHGNELYGNDGDNVIEGRGGDDILRGGSGADTAIFRGTSTEYDIKPEGEGIRVTDREPGRDGSDLLEEMETLRFMDCEKSI